MFRDVSEVVPEEGEDETESDEWWGEVVWEEEKKKEEVQEKVQKRMVITGIGERERDGVADV